MHKKIIRSLWVVLIVFLLATGCVHSEQALNSNSKHDGHERLKVPEPIEINIAAVGDIMVHGPQIRAQYDPEAKNYEFRNNFQFVRNYIEQADIALVNLETTFAGAARGYSSYPLFNSPDAVAIALKDTGFDIVSTVNNHTYDTGMDGMIRTQEVLSEQNMDVIGTRTDESNPEFLIKEVKGIKMGVIGYTYETDPWKGQKTLNGNQVDPAVESLINTFNYDTLDEDLMRIKNQVKMMQSQGAELVVCFIHWGDEYHRSPNNNQIKMAQALSNYGVDIIFGSHPHVLQPISWIQSEVDEHQTLVAYSMGNFLSNQRYEILKNRYTEDGIIVNVKIIKDLELNQIRIEDVSYVPTWVHRYYEKDKPIYEILPVCDALENLAAYHLTSEDSIMRVQNSKNNTIDLIESEPSKQIHIAQ